ncbi:hypothetical protein DMN91_007535 [Ooceraea biroi]|uniref:Uncharacterized protein n=1 Tax=Ooceraea biroi TaxID=2015173 RepID=A0A3L8DKM6_OOCBI|nr:hypothetical protein DMN91_007535 [Ooceraea biroi]
MLINGELIPFSQGFCCSCEDVVAQRAGSFDSIVTKSNHYQQNDSADGARNRSESSTNLFDNSKAQRQIVANKEYSRAGLENGGARGRVTSHNISVVTGSLDERASPFRKHQEKEQLRNNSIRQPNRLSQGLQRVENRSNMQTPSSMLKSVIFDPMPSKGKIEAFIDTVYEQAMKERSMKQSVKQQDNERNENLLDNCDRAGNFSDPKIKSEESNSRINDRYSIDGSVSDYSQHANVKLINAKGDYNISKSESRMSSPQYVGRWSDDRYLIHGSVTDNPQNATTKLIKLKSEENFRKVSGKQDNRKFLEPEKCDRSENFLERGNDEKKPKDRSYGAIRLGGTFDYTSTSLATYSSRIPEGNLFSRRTQKNALPNGGNVLLDNSSLATTVEFFASFGIPFRSSVNENINYAATPAIELNGFAKDMFALLSNIVISETHSSMESKDREFRMPESISSNVNASRNASSEWRNLSAAAIRNDNARGEERKAENANVLMRISTTPAFTRLRNLPSPAGISKLEELSVPTAAARPGDKSSTRILESRTCSSLLANEIQGSSDDFGNLYERQESRRIYNSPEQMPKDVNLKNSYKFWKPHQKLRKLKDTTKFYKDKNIAENFKRFGKSSSNRELISKRALSDFKRDRFQNGLSKREKRFQRRLRRHLRTGKKIFNSTQRDELNNEDSHRKTQGFINYHVRSQVAHPKCKISENKRNGNSTKQVILEPGQSYRKVQSEENDNPFIFGNEGGKESNIDKRIEDRFVQISNVLKEDSPETRIIHTPESFQAVAKKKNEQTDIPKIRDGLNDDSFLQGADKFNESSVTRDDEVTREYSAELIDTQRSAMDDDFLTESTMTSDEVITVSTTITWRNNYGEFAFHELEGRLSDTIIGPFLSSPIMRKPGHRDLKKINSTKSINPIYQTVHTKKRTGFLTQELLSTTTRGGNTNDYSEITGGPLGALSSSWTSSKQATTSPGVLNNRSESERDEAENAKFLEFNNNSLRMIAGNSAQPRAPPIAPGLSLRGSVTEPRASPRNEEGEPARYIEDPLAENLRDVQARKSSMGSQEKDEIAKLVDRIVRQYAAYTPIMPGMPTFDEITEPETLPPEAETTATQLMSITTLATTTRITDKVFRPSIRPLVTTPLPGEIHDEIRDETTFIEETEREATTANRKTTTAKWTFQAGRSEAKSALSGKAQRVYNKTEKSGKPKQKITCRITNSSTKLSDAEGETEVHPWYRTTEMQQIIAANRSKPARKTKEKKRKQHYESKIEYFGDSTSSDWSSSTIASSSVMNEAAQTRSKRADFIRESGDRSSSVFCDYEGGDEEDRRSGRTATNKSEESPDMVKPNGLRPEIEKRLAGELDYPAIRESSRRSCESEERTQEHNVALENIVARDVGLRTVNDDQRENEQDTQGSLKNFTSLNLHYAKDDAISKLNEDLSPANRRKVISAFIDIPSRDLALRKDLSGSMYERIEIDRRMEADVKKHAFGERVAAEIDKIVAMRKIAVNLSGNARTASANADNSTYRPAEPREEPATSRILLDCVKSPVDQDKGRKVETVIRGAKLMTANDFDVAAKSVDETISPLFVAAKQPGRKDAKKINENPMDVPVHRVSSGKKYFRRPRGNVRDIIRRIIGKLYRGKSSSASVETGIGKSIVRSEKGVDRSPLDWHRSGRRLLSSGESSYVEDANDEYYEDDESENNSVSDNKAIARSENLSGSTNQPGLYENRDRRKLAVKTQRLVGENIDAVGTMMPQEQIIAVRDTEMIPNDVQAVSEGTISRLLIYGIY